eukprot:Em0001g3645a
MRERTILVMPARMIVLLLIMSGDVEENPGPGIEELLDSACSTEHLNIIAATFSYDWRVVGRRLVDSQDVDDIEREGHSEQEMRDKLFEVWKRRRGSGATYRVVMKAFNDVKNQQAAEMLKDLLSSIPQGVPQAAQTTPSSAASPLSVEIVAGDIDLNEKDVIGEGGQGCVYKAFWKVKQKPVAVKKIGVLSNAAKREIETLRSVRHKNIVTFYGVYEISSQRFCMVLELADTSLDQHLKKSTPSSETSLNWAQQVGQGMHYLHFDVPEAIIHGDLKSPNVLVYSDSVLKIGDFGSSKFKFGQQSSVTRMTIEWTAPELFDDGKHSMESDIYAFGILLWEIVTHEVPYKGLSGAQIMSRVNKNQRPTIPSFCHERLRRIIQECWDSEPKNRPSFKTILQLLEAANGSESQKVAKLETISKKGHSLMAAILDEHDHAKIFQTTKSARDKWRAIGWELGFTFDELDSIVREPGRNGDEDYYEATLKRWLDWAPPNHTPPSFQSLVSALRAAGKERQANDLAAKSEPSAPWHTSDIKSCLAM